MKKTIIAILMLCVFAGIASAETFTFETGDYEVIGKGNYEILNVTNLFMDSFMGGLSFKGVEIKEFSQNQPIDEIRLIKFYDPVDLTLNLPGIEETYDNDTGELIQEYVDRACHSDTSEAEFYVADPLIIENMAAYYIEFYPLEVVDCEAGHYILYQKADYEIVKHVSPVRVKRVVFMPSSAPGKETTFNVELNLPAKGEIKLVDDYGKVVATKKTEGTKFVEISTMLPEVYDTTTYTIEFWEDGKRISFMNAEVATEWGTVDFEVYVSDDEQILPVKITLQNNAEKEIDVELKLQLTDWDLNVDQEDAIEKKAAPGINVFNVNLEIKGNYTNDDLTVIATYNEISRSVTHNTLMRKDPEVAKWAKEEIEKEKEAEKEPTKKSNIIAIIAAGAMFILMGYLAFRFFGRKEEY